MLWERLYANIVTRLSNIMKMTKYKSFTHPAPDARHVKKKNSGTRIDKAPR
jgi:hypothetical protein